MPGNQLGNSWFTACFWQKDVSVHNVWNEFHSGFNKRGKGSGGAVTKQSVQRKHFGQLKKNNNNNGLQFRTCTNELTLAS